MKTILLALSIIICLLLLTVRPKDIDFTAKTFNSPVEQKPLEPAVEGWHLDLYQIIGVDSIKHNSLLRVKLKRVSDGQYFAGLASPLDSLKLNMNIEASFCTYWQSTADKVGVLIVHSRSY